jgi:hypothetical protein
VWLNVTGPEKCAQACSVWTCSQQQGPDPWQDSLQQRAPAPEFDACVSAGVLAAGVNSLLVPAAELAGSTFAFEIRCADCRPEPSRFLVSSCRPGDKQEPPADSAASASTSVPGISILTVELIMAPDRADLPVTKAPEAEQPAVVAGSRATCVWVLWLLRAVACAAVTTICYVV